MAAEEIQVTDWAELLDLFPAPSKEALAIFVDASTDLEGWTVNGG